MRGSKNVKTYVDPVPIELPVDQSVSLRDEIMEQVRAMVALEREQSESPETIEEFWDLSEEDDEDPISSAYEVEDMQEEFLAPEVEVEATPEPTESPGTEPEAEPPAAASTT